MEWWFWNPDAHVGHLRITLTSVETTLVPPGQAVHDAGETGKAERRNYPPVRKARP